MFDQLEPVMTDRVALYHADCVDVLSGLPANCVDAVFTDPPYHLSTTDRYGRTSIDNANDSNSRRARAPTQDDAFARLSRRFMGTRWDGGDVAFRVETWRHVERILKPGGFLLSFGGSRTIHKIASAIEGAGFDIRDMLFWCFGTGVPKSHGQDVAPGKGSAIKPASEPIVLARKPMVGTIATNYAAHGTGLMNIDACLINGETYPCNVQHDGTVDLPPFFYCAKAGAADRNGSDHPSVKPVALIRHYVRLICPPGGVLLDPFAGSGTAIVAAQAEGLNVIAIEQDANHFWDCKRRVIK